MSLKASDKTRKRRSDLGPAALLSRWVQRIQSIERLPNMTRWQRLSLHYLRVLLFVSRWEVLDKLRLRAQALAYQTVFAIVPLLAVFFAIFKGFGGMETLQTKLESVIMESLSGSPEMSQQLAQYVRMAVDNVSGGTIGVVALVLLIYSVIGLLQSIEDSLNSVFDVKKGRAWDIRIVLYWSALTLGPLLIGASLAMTAALQTSKVSELVESLGIISALLIECVPLAVTCFAFFAMYMVVPNARVRPSAAVFAGLTAGSLWSLAKFAYAIYAKHNVTTQNIYGAMAAIPLFFLWIYVSWIIVLFGAQLAFAFQNAATYREEDEAARASQATRERAAVRLFLEIARDFFAGRPATDPERAAAALGIPRRLIERLANELTAGGFIHAVEDRIGLLPARDLALISVGDVLTYLRHGVGTHTPGAQDAPRRYIEELFGQLEKDQAEIAGTITFRQLAQRFVDAPHVRPEGLEGLVDADPPRELPNEGPTTNHARPERLPFPDEPTRPA